MAEILIVFLIHLYAHQYQVDPYFCESVARVECGSKGLRAGPLDKRKLYYGPFAIHKDFLKKWPIDDPQENIRRGVLALRGSDKNKILHRYNKTCDSAYIKAVMDKYRELKRVRTANRTTR